MAGGGASRRLVAEGYAMHFSPQALTLGAQVQADVDYEGRVRATEQRERLAMMAEPTEGLGKALVVGGLVALGLLYFLGRD